MTLFTDERTTPAMQPFAGYSAFADHLDALGLFRMLPGLERMQAGLDALQLTQLPCCVVQVAGTNGKGSTAAMLDALARAHGVKTLLYTSPHFLTPRERIRVDGRLLSEAGWTQLANEVMTRGRGEDMTYFELLTAMAAVAAARETVDLCILEAGLGGTWDATTALDRGLVVYTRIALDHQNVLGDTLAAIARDTAGAMQSAPQAVSTSQDPAAAAVLESMAAKYRCKLHYADNLAAKIPEVSLAGPHQQENARTALAAFFLVAKKLGILPDGGRCRQALDTVQIPARLQTIPALLGKYPELIIDAAHNPDGLAALGRALQAMGRQPESVLFACLADKDSGAMARERSRIADGTVLVAPLPASPRTLAAPELAAQLRSAGVRAEPAGSVADALGRSCGLTLVCGSFYLLAEVFRMLPDALETDCFAAGS